MVRVNKEEKESELSQQDQCISIKDEENRRSCQRSNQTEHQRSSRLGTCDSDTCSRGHNVDDRMILPLNGGQPRAHGRVSRTVGSTIGPLCRKRGRRHASRRLHQLSHSRRGNVPFGRAGWCLQRCGGHAQHEKGESADAREAVETALRAVRTSLLPHETLYVHMIHMGSSLLPPREKKKEKKKKEA